MNLVLGILREHELLFESSKGILSESLNSFTGFALPQPEATGGVCFFLGPRRFEFSTTNPGGGQGSTA